MQRYKPMNERRRRLLLIAGLALVLAGLLLLAYACWPLPHQRILEAAPATLFAVPR